MFGSRTNKTSFRDADILFPAHHTYVSINSRILEREFCWCFILYTHAFCHLKYDLLNNEGLSCCTLTNLEETYIIKSEIMFFLNVNEVNIQK